MQRLHPGLVYGALSGLCELAQLSTAELNNCSIERGHARGLTALHHSAPVYYAPSGLYRLESYNPGLTAASAGCSGFTLGWCMAPFQGFVNLLNCQLRRLSNCKN